jgi:hypothetical protein
MIYKDLHLLKEVNVIEEIKNGQIKKEILELHLAILVG